MGNNYFRNELNEQKRLLCGSDDIVDCGITCCSNLNNSFFFRYPFNLLAINLFTQIIFLFYNSNRGKTAKSHMNTSSKCMNRLQLNSREKLIYSLMSFRAVANYISNTLRTFLLSAE